jgi:hypothetical protein
MSDYLALLSCIETCHAQTNYISEHYAYISLAENSPYCLHH